MKENEIYQIADKIGAVLERFYSLHETDELTRVITDPSKSIEDVKAYMDVIYQRNIENRMVESTETQLQKPIELKTEEDLVKALKEKYPDGLDVHMDGLTADDLFGYIQFGDRDDHVPELLPLEQETQNSEQVLMNTFHLSPDKYNELMPVVDGTYYDDEVQKMIDSQQSLHDEATTVLMSRHPDLTGARLDFKEPRMLYGWQIEGHPLDEVLSIMLQMPHISTENLKELLNNPVQMEMFKKSMELKKEEPANIFMKKNPDYLYFYRPGILGYARVDRGRSVTFSGERFPTKDWNQIMEVVSNRNLPYTNDRNTFFINPAPKTESRLFMNTREDKAVVIHMEKDLDGKVMPTRYSEMVKNMDYLQDISGRLTDAQVITPVNGKPFVRCKIDGVQQSGSTLTKNDIIKMGHYNHSPEEQKLFAVNMAVKHFAGELLDNGREQSKGMKR